MTDSVYKDQPQNEDEFEISQEILETVFEELPPENVVAASNPSSVGMDKIIAGIALGGITFNFLALNYILPTIGFVLLVLGFRNLHSENSWFKLAYICSVLRLIIQVPQLILNATVYSGYLQGSIGKVMLYCSCALKMLMLFAFWMAIDKVQEKAGIKEKSFSAGALFLWHSLTLIAAVMGLNSILVGIIMVVAFIMIIRNLISLSRLMGINGYLITAAPVKVGDNVLAEILAGVIIAGIACGYIFFADYNMDWKPVEIGACSSDEIYGRLLSLGYPEEQLKDLSPEELKLLRDADCVFFETDEQPLNNGVEKTEHYDGGMQIYTEYPVKELKMTHVAVRIAGDGKNGELWRVIHHFALDDDLKMKGTANLQLWGLESTKGWSGPQDLSGRLLCCQSGQDVTAEYQYIGNKSYTSTDLFGILRAVSSCMCDFSMPAKATDRRGYVAYTSGQTANGYLLNAWFNYTHQLGYVQYPVKSAGQYVSEGMHLKNYPFITAQSALQFYVRDGKPSALH